MYKTLLNLLKTLVMWKKDDQTEMHHLSHDTGSKDDELSLQCISDVNL